MKRAILALVVATGLLTGCNKDNSAEGDSNTLWIYTSMYKDTIKDLEPLLAEDFPGVEFKWFQAGSEDIAAKVNGEILAGQLKADVLISSDRFWYEEMGNQGNLISYAPKGSSEVDSQLKHPNSYYHTVSIPVMVMAYNNEVIKKDQAPKSYKEMMEDKYKGLFTTGSPLSSGTNFTTMAMLQHHYSWDYFKKLKANETIAQGGNSAVIRRIQNKERPIGWVLLENLLRFQGKDERLEIVYPEDGVVIHSNVMGITAKKGNRDLAKKFADWMYGEKGQSMMTKSFMYSPIPSFDPPTGAPPFSKLLENSFEWTQDFIKKVTETRSELKETYTEIMFQ